MSNNYHFRSLSPIKLLVFLSFLIVLISCEAEEPQKPTEEIGETVVLNGITYKTLTVGDQTWLAENYQVPEPYGWSFKTDSTQSLYGHYSNVPDINPPLVPEGWRVPNALDYAELFANIAPPGKELHSYASISSPSYPIIWFDQESMEKLLAKDAWFHETSNETGFNLFPGTCDYTHTTGYDIDYPKTDAWVQSQGDENLFWRNRSSVNDNVETVKFGDIGAFASLHINPIPNDTTSYERYPKVSPYNLFIGTHEDGTFYVAYEEALRQRSSSEAGSHTDLRRGVVRLIKD